MTTMTDWVVDSEERFLAFHDATVRDAYRYASRLAGGDRYRAEELVQDAYYELLRQVRAGALREVGPGWVVVTIRHRFLDGLRNREREERRLRLVWSRPDASERHSPSDGGVLDGALLSDRERAALTLRYVDDLPVADVDAAIGTTVRATESLLARARARVRAEVRDA
jgi:RNA polymerase sigma-70 factor (ECF subfamily)